MDFKKNKNLITFVVLLVAFGLVVAYVPIFFTPSQGPTRVPQRQEEDETALQPPATALITPPAVTEPEVATTTPTSTQDEESMSIPDSFQGLEEESESLDELLEGF